MIYQYDQAIEMPTMNVYDNGLLGAYISSVKDDYQQGLKDYKEFMTKYGDFMSPIQKSVEWWNNNVNAPVFDFIRNASAAGIDMRSPEFRSSLYNLTTRLPYQQMKMQQQSAKMAEQYLQNRAAMQRAGQFDADYEKYLLGGHSLEDWDPITMGMWNRVSPEQLTSLTDFSKKATAGLKPGFIRTENGYDVNGITQQKVEDTIRKSAPDYLNTQSGRYYLDQVAKANGLNLNNAADKQTATNLVLQDAVNRSGAAYEVRNANPYSQMDYQHKLTMEEKEADTERAIRLVQAKYDAKTKADKEKGFGSLFDMANKRGLNGVIYNPANSVNEGITPISNHISVLRQKESSSTTKGNDTSEKQTTESANINTTKYKFNSTRDAGLCLFKVNTDGSSTSHRINMNGNFTFKPTGKLVCRHVIITKDGKRYTEPRYYIAGTLNKSNDNNNNNKTNIQLNGTNIFYLPVVETRHTKTKNNSYDSSDKDEDDE